MPTVEERLASLETKVDAIADLRLEMRRQFEQVDQRFDQIDQRFDRLERRNDILDDRADRHFLWIVGIQMTILMAIVAALARGAFQ